MTAPTETATGINFPSRDELIAWGLRPCKTDGCRILVNVEVTGKPFCTSCTTRYLRQKRKEGK